MQKALSLIHFKAEKRNAAILMLLMLLAYGGLSQASYAQKPPSQATQRSVVSRPKPQYSETPVAAVQAFFNDYAALMSVSTAHTLGARQPMVADRPGGTSATPLELVSDNSNHYDRLSSLLEWVSNHALDYTAITVRSKFVPDAMRQNGSVAWVSGVETVTLNLTVSTSSTPGEISADKALSVAQAHREGRVYRAGAVVHSLIEFRHQILLCRSGPTWQVQRDDYVDGPPFQSNAPSSYVLESWKGSAARLFGVRCNDSVDQEIFSPETAASSDLSAGRIGIESYGNRAGAYQYADRWWNDRNLYYGLYLSDCTNFISQCLYDRNGGQWAWDPDWHPFSVAFINADECYNWMRRTSMRLANDGANNYGAAYWWQKKYLMRGDLVFYDWDRNGSKDHSAIGVAYDNNMNVYVDAHTNNRYHAPWDLWQGLSPNYYMLCLR